MARSDPARSDYCATRHLLRHLHHERELRRNPLARDAFAGVAPRAALGTIEARAYAALRAMDVHASARIGQHGRQAAILLRVDVQRHDPARVAADLSLSNRQFHRERRAAHERFFAAYCDLGYAWETADTSDLPQRLVERAASLADSGEVASAVALLDDVAAHANLADRCDALLHLSEIEAWAHRLDRAEVKAREAGALLAALPPSDDRYRELCDADAALELLLGWFRFGPASVRTAHAHETEAGARETLVRAAAALRNGEAAYALRLLNRLEGAGTPLPSVVDVDRLTLQAEIADFFGREESLSEALFERATSVAYANGLRGRALYASHQLASTRWMHTRTPFDRGAYRALVDGIDRSFSPRLRSYLIFSAADIEIAIGHPRRALQAAQMAAAVSTNHYETFSAQGLAAAALLRLGYVEDAAVTAAAAAQSARSHGHPRVVSLAQRIQAMAQLSRGNRRAALAAIEESLECAKRFSSAHVIAQTKAVREQIARR